MNLHWGGELTPLGKVPAVDAGGGYGYEFELFLNGEFKTFDEIEGLVRLLVLLLLFIILLGLKTYDELVLFERGKELLIETNGDCKMLLLIILGG